LQYQILVRRLFQAVIDYSFYIRIYKGVLANKATVHQTDFHARIINNVGRTKSSNIISSPEDVLIDKQQ
jgi:hypothetical protein